jgi:hypothetical protein
MALDEPQESDLIFKIAGFAYIMNTDLFALIKPVNVDCTPAGFLITGSIDAGDIPTGCGHY